MPTNYLPSRKIIHTAASSYGAYSVVDITYNGRPSRILYGAGDSPQSGLALDSDSELLFDYNQRFLEIIMSVQPGSILIIGGGAGTLPKAAFELFPSSNIDVVEIDSLLIELGHKFFSLPHAPRLQFIIDDALHYLKNTARRYDIIIIDAFSGYNIPPHLLRRNTIQIYSNHLENGGVVAINFISEYKQDRPSLAHEIVANFSTAFPYTSVYQSNPGYMAGADQNFLLVASDNHPHLDYLQSARVEPA